MMFDVDEKLHARLVISLSLIARALALVLVYVGAVASTPFDSSHLALEPVAAPLEKWALSGLRWDVFHFTHIAQNGYVYEYEYAFMPGTPAIMRLAAFVAQILGVIRWDRTPSQGELLVCGFMMSTLLDPTWSLYKLTKCHTGSAQFALLTCVVAILTTSPATWLAGSYSEPFYTFFALRGLIFLSRRGYFLASVAFAFATLFRANGILLTGFIIWSLIVAPFLRTREVKLLPILYASLLAGVCVSPFVLHQLRGYWLFCVSAKHEAPRKWCGETIPAIYPFVQAHYWNVGIFKYWRVDQLPNFLLALPPLMLLVSSAATTIQAALPYVVHRATSTSSFGKRTANVAHETSSRDIEMFPHAIHASVMAFILIFASHTQIALRVIPTLPYMHWSVAALFNHKPGPVKKWWMYWCVIWWAVNCVLWGAFLPPA